MSKRILSGKALSIQLGREETHIVLVGKNAELLYGISVATPAGAVDDGVIRDEEAVRQMLKEALATPEFARVRKAVFCMVTSQIITEKAMVPDISVQKLEKLIESNVDMYFPVDVQDCHVVWQVTGSRVQDGLREQEVQLWAVPNSLVGPYYKVANDCGLSLLAIDYCGNSITSAVGATYASAGTAVKRGLTLELGFGKKKESSADTLEPAAGDIAPVSTDLHITMERDLLGMTFVQQGRVVQQRFIRCGANPVYQIGEISMMVDYFRSLDIGRGSKLRGILSGALAEETILIAELSDVLDISLSTFPVTYDTSWFLCAGAALTKLDFGIPALNRAGKARREFQAQVWQYALILASALAVMGVLLLTMTSRLSWQSQIRKLENEQQVLAVRAAQSNGFADNYYAYEDAYNNYRSDWRQVFDKLQTYNDNLGLVLQELEDLMPDNASVEGMQIGYSGLNVIFATETKEEAAYLMMVLREMQYANLTEISSLQGGGAGPAKSYGTGREKAPSEGSSGLRKTWDQLSQTEKQKIYQPILDDVTKYELAYWFGLGKTVEDNMDALYDACGLSCPGGGLLDLSAYTRAERSAAFSAMFTTNPFAMQLASDLLMGAVEGDLESPLAQYIISQSTLSPIDLRYHTSVKDLQEDVEELVDLITWENPTYDALSDTEALILTDGELSGWYAYYLDHFQGTDPDTAGIPGCINTDNIIYAVVNDPQAEPVNTLLYNKCLSAETRALIEEVTAAQDPSGGDDKPDVPDVPTETTAPQETTDPEAEKEAAMKAALPGLMTEYLTVGSVDSLTGGELLAYGSLLGMPLEKYMDAQLTAYHSGTLEDGEMKNAIRTYYESLPEDTQPTTGDTEPTTGDTEPTPGESTPTTGDTEPTPGESTPTTGDTEPTPGESTPTTGDTEPTPGESTPDQTGPSGENTEPTVDPDSNEAKIEAMLQYYLPSYILQGKVSLIGDYSKYEKDVNGLLELYFSSGSTGMELQGVDVDKVLNDHIAAGKADQALTIVMIQYLEDPSGLKASAIRDMLDNYYAGGTGNTVLDTQLDACKEKRAEILGQWLANYLGSASTGNSYGDPIIKDYLGDGKTVSMENTQMLDQYVAAGKVDAQLTMLIQMYTLKKADLEAYPVLFTLMEKYYTQDGRTGSDAMDNRIKELGKALLDKLAQNAMNAGKGKQQPYEPVDNRYFFAVSLEYNGELRNAELLRKGLDPYALVEKLEVEE